MGGKRVASMSLLRGGRGNVGVTALAGDITGVLQGGGGRCDWDDTLATAHTLDALTTAARSGERVAVEAARV